MANVTFIGLGNMGLPMSRHLIKAGHVVTGYDVTHAAREALAAEGGRVARSLAEAVGSAEYVISMLPTGRHVREVYEGRDGVLTHAPVDAVLMDSSTIDVDSSRAVNAAAGDAGFTMVDAPVSGAVPAAEAGRLTFMVGGTPEAYEKALPVLQAMGTNFFYIGGAGAGHALKICNNMMTGISMVAISETIALAQKLGLDLQTVFDVMVKSSGNCWALQQYCPCPGPLPTSPANRDYEPGFALTMMLKDMRLSQQAAGAVAAATPMASSAAAIYQIAAANGQGERDFSVVFEFLAGQSAPAGADTSLAAT